MTLSPVHGAVLGAAALVVSPAIWLALVAGTLPLQDALIRFLIAVPLCWVALNVVATWFLPSADTGGAGTPGELPGTDAATP